MPIQYTVSKTAKDLLADDAWKTWNRRETANEHSSEAECIEPNPYALCESPSLRLTTFVRLGKETRRYTKRFNHKKTTDNSRSTEVSSIVKCCNAHQKTALLPSLICMIPRAEQIVARLESRLIVDQAGGLIENGSLRLHPHFGYPFIPGSSVKGIARHVAWEAWNDLPEGDPKREAAKNLAIIFGFPTGDDGLDDYIQKNFPDKISSSTTFSGSVVFFPAEPLGGKAMLEEDILTPHTGPDPIPNAFPVVKAGSQFVFTIAPIDRACPLGRTPDLSGALGFLKSALENHGVGAKTRAGYGLFKILDETESQGSLQEHKDRVDSEHANLLKQVTDFSTAVQRTNMDWRTVNPDQNILNELNGLSQRRIKRKFPGQNGQDQEMLQDPVYCRTLMEVLLNGKHQIIWEREKNNPNGLICNTMTEWANKFGVSL